MSKIEGRNFEFMLTKADFGWNIMFILGWCSREVYISLLVLWGKHSNAPKCDGYTASCVGKMLLAQNNFSCCMVILMKDNNSFCLDF